MSSSVPPQRNMTLDALLHPRRDYIITDLTHWYRSAALQMKGGGGENCQSKSQIWSQRLYWKKRKKICCNRAHNSFGAKWEWWTEQTHVYQQTRTAAGVLQTQMTSCCWRQLQAAAAWKAKYRHQLWSGAEPRKSYLSPSAPTKRPWASDTLLEELLEELRLSGAQVCSPPLGYSCYWQIWETFGFFFFCFHRCVCPSARPARKWTSETVQETQWSGLVLGDPGLDQGGPPPSILSISGICLTFLTFHSFSFLLNSLPLSLFLSLSLLSLTICPPQSPFSSLFSPSLSLPLSSPPSLLSLPKTWQWSPPWFFFP